MKKIINCILKAEECFLKMKKIQTLGLFLFIASLVLIIFSTNSYAMFSYEVDVSPEKPVAASEVSFTATFDNDSLIEEVRIIISECNENTGICYADSTQNLSMTKVNDGQYNTTASLTHSDATYLQYTLLLKRNESWSSYLNETKVDLKSQESNDSENNEVKDTPAFGIIAIVMAAVFVLILNYRKKEER